MIDVSAELVLFLSAMIFAVGLIGLLVRRNLIYILMSVEIMLNASGMAFIAAGSKWAQPDGQVMFVFILTMAAAEVAVGLALVMQIFGKFKTLDSDAVSSMKG
jgi:NADH-quinone oxidoreductase subunit K